MTHCSLTIVYRFEVFYTVDTEGAVVAVLRVIYGGRNIDQAFHT